MIINNNFIFVKEYIPKENTDTTVIITHGIAEHSSSYEELANFLKEKGIKVITYDLRGHGRSSGKRGYIDSYKTYLKDLDDIISYAYEKSDKVFLLGHSLGGVITSIYASTYKTYDGLIISSAPSDHINEISKRRLFHFLWKRKKIKVKKKISNKIDKTIEDILYLDYYYAKIPIEVLYKGINYLKKNFKKISKKTLIIHGKNDRLVPYSSSVNLLNKLAVNDKKLISYENVDHNIFDSSAKNIVFEDIYKFLKKEEN